MKTDVSTLAMQLARSAGEQLLDELHHAEDQHYWDPTAPVAVAHAVGLHASCIDGSPLTYNQEDVLLPDMVVCRPRSASSGGHRDRRA